MTDEKVFDEWEFKIGNAEFRRDLGEWEALEYLEGELWFDGADTEYKGIFYKGKLVTIASKKYKLFPNEKAMEVAGKVAEKLGGTIGQHYWAHPVSGIQDWGAQMHVLLGFQNVIMTIGDTNFSHGLMIYNSVDGSLKFGMRSFLTIQSGTYGTVVTFLPYRRDLSAYVGKHMKSLETSTEKLTTIGQAILDHDEDLTRILEELNKTEANEEHWRILKEVLPEKFFKDIRTDEKRNLMDVYTILGHKIWFNDKTDMPAKLTQFDTLHEKMFDLAFIAKIAEVTP